MFVDETHSMIATWQTVKHIKDLSNAQTASTLWLQTETNWVCVRMYFTCCWVSLLISLSVIWQWQFMVDDGSRFNATQSTGKLISGNVKLNVSGTNFVPQLCSYQFKPSNLMREIIFIIYAKRSFTTELAHEMMLGKVKQTKLDEEIHRVILSSSKYVKRLRKRLVTCSLSTLSFWNGMTAG